MKLPALKATAAQTFATAEGLLDRPIKGPGPQAALPVEGVSPSLNIAPEGRTTSWIFIISLTLAVVALMVAVNLSYRYERDFYLALYTSSGHVITPTLIGGLAMVIFVMGSLLVIGNFTPRALGWQWSRFGLALALVVGLWLVMQLIEILFGAATGQPIHLSPSWENAGWSTVIGVLLGQVLGIAPGEETFFRGFMLPQLLRKFSPFGATTGVLLAVGLSQLSFSLFHLPNLLLINSAQVGSGALDIAVQLGLDLVVGVVFAGIYLRTGNLFLVMGIHALQNAGVTVVAAAVRPALVVFILAIVTLIATFVPSRAAKRGIHSRFPLRRLNYRFSHYVQAQPHDRPS